MITDYDVIVTGATGRVGQSICRSFVSSGRKVFKIAKSLGHDLTDEVVTREILHDHRAPYLINCFALNDQIDKDHKGDLTVAKFRQYMEVNVTTLYSVCKAWLDYNPKGTWLEHNPKANQDQDRAIVNFSSVYGVVAPDPDMYAGVGAKHPGYCVSKAAVIGLTKYLASYYESWARSNCIVLGPLKSPNMPKEFVDRMDARHPTQIFGEAKDVVGLVDLLCSNRSSYMNGSVITLDGGYTLT